MTRVLLGFMLALLSTLSSADDLYMVRSQFSFPETMSVLQQAIRDHGLKLSRVQRVDIGLTTFGYETDKYRVVFFGKLDDIREVGARHPDLLPYLPMKIAIFAEGDETILLASSFRHLRAHYPDAFMQKTFDAWEKDIQSILDRVRTTE